MNELKIYIKMKGNVIENEVLPVTEIVDQCNLLFLQMAKYKIMWMLRKIENQYRESGGFIIIELASLDSELKAEGHNFDLGFQGALRVIIPDIVFYNEPQNMTNA